MIIKPEIVEQKYTSTNIHITYNLKCIPLIGINREKLALYIILERKTIYWYHGKKDKKHPLHNDPFCRTILNNAGTYSNSGHIIVVVTFKHPSIIYARVSAEIVQKVCQTCKKKNETRNETCNVKSDLVIVVWSIISCLLVKFPYVSSCYRKTGNLLRNNIL